MNTTAWWNISGREAVPDNKKEKEAMKIKILSPAFGVLLWILLASAFTFCGNSTDHSREEEPEYFNNPILEEGADPYVYFHSDGYYYCMVTRGDRLKIWKSKSFTDLAGAESSEIWFPPDSGSNSCCIWAPEIHFFDDTWYVYYSATDAQHPDDLHRHVHVLRNNTGDPFEDSWEDLGMIRTKYPGIDGHVFEYRGTRYFAYSPYIGNQSGIMLARMTSPTTIEQETNLGLPVYDWEKTPPRAILEGPQFLEGPGDKVFIIYSAGACWDDNYGLGMFYTDKEADLLYPDSWERSTRQVFEQCPDSSVFGPGHNCFTTSPDLSEDWIVYHAKKFSSNECSGRSMRAQRFTWDENGMPVFGKPFSIETPIPEPSGLTE
ncbi:MAG TPA: alpha-N-arabinofuranosidase [Bacteroides sp.]|nr:alpha-N-arabinofuranosidase [Bacteroides sp.]